MNTVKFRDNDIYFMEVVEDRIVVNDNYCGLLLLNSKLEQVGKIDIFDGLTIYSSYRCGKRMLLFCPDNDCFVLVDLHLNKKSVLPLNGFESCIFLPLFLWKQNNIILSDYRGQLVDINFANYKINQINSYDLEYQKIRQEFEKLRYFQICKIYSEKNKAIVFDQTSKVKFIDYNEKVKVIKELEKEKYFDFEWSGAYIAKISENSVEIIHDTYNFILNSENDFEFLKGKIMQVNGRSILFLLSAMKSDAKNSKIDSIQLECDSK